MALTAKQLRQLNNERVAKYFAAAICGIIALFTIFHWSKFLWRRYGSKEKGMVVTHISACSRAFRSVMSRKVPGFNSAGHLTLFVLYIAINIILTFVNMDWSILNNFGKRLGWIAIVNLTLVIFLSLKNTPLSPLTSTPHSTLNNLHRLSGYTTIFYAILHMIIYLVAYSQASTLYKIKQWMIVAGIIALISFLIMGVTGTFLRSKQYEMFYVIHIVFFILTMITMGYHLPELSSKGAIVIIVGSCLWGADRIIRGTKILGYSIGNFATLVPLENGGTRIFLQKAPFGAKAGEHVFLWIPSVRMFETHPFTIVRVDQGGVEFVVARQDGFTRDLYNHAVANPGKRVRASVDGPYGINPCFEGAEKVLLIAGGSGASFSAGIGVELAKKNSSGMKIEFIWVLRNQAQISWYSTELQSLKSSPNVTIKIHHTSPTNTSSSPYLAEKPTPSISTTSIHSQPKSPQSPNQYSSESEMEKAPNPTAIPISQTLLQGLEMRDGRPDLDYVIRESIKGMSGRTVICACGPEGMMRGVRDTGARVVVGGGGGVDVFLENFGW